jgi:hypothetical protein
MPVSRKLKARIYGGRSRRRRNKVARKPKPRKNKSSNNVAGAGRVTKLDKTIGNTLLELGMMGWRPPEESRPISATRSRRRQEPDARRPKSATQRRRNPRSPGPPPSVPITAWTQSKEDNIDLPPPDNPTLKSTADFKTADGDEQSIDDIIVKLTREIITRKLIGATRHIKKLEDALTRLQEFKTDFYYK